MKRLTISILALTLCAFSAFAQTADEIVTRMEKELEKHDDSEGMTMTVDVKMPILGTISTKSYILGEKVRMEVKAAGTTVITWTDNVTDWVYMSKTNELTISDSKPNSSDSGSGSEMDMFDGLTDGYTVSIKKEDDTSWYISCKKRKDNKEKDDPKNIDLVVRKADYYPTSLSASVSGMKMTIRDIAFGVSEETVTFHNDDCPGAKIIDKR